MSIVFHNNTYLFNDAERYETDATVMSQNYPVVFDFHPPVNKMSSYTHFPFSLTNCKLIAMFHPAAMSMVED